MPARCQKAATRRPP